MHAVAETSQKLEKAGQHTVQFPQGNSDTPGRRFCRHVVQLVFGHGDYASQTGSLGR